MRVLSQCGTTAGHVIDVPPLSARAMLADGRALPVPEAGVQSDPPPAPKDPSDGPAPIPILRTIDDGKKPKKAR